MKRLISNGLLIIVTAIFVLFLFGLVLFSQSGINAKTPEVSAVPENRFEKTLVVITDEDYSPYSFYDNKGGFSGHDVELIIMIANELEMNLELRLMNWYEAIDAMSAGEADVLMTCDYSDTFAGVDKLVKCEPVSFDDFIVYSKKKIESSDELYGKRIAIMKNGNVVAQIDMMNLERYCIEYENNRKAMQALISGEADCAIMRQTVGTVLLQELDAKGIEGYLGIGQSFMCFGVRDEDTADKINGAIETLKMNGELNRLHEKWLTTFVRPYTVREVIQNNIWLIAVFWVLVAIVFITLLVSHIRKKKNEEEEQRQLQLAENNTRILALEDSFEVLYDVELDTGRYDIFVKGQTFGDVNNNLINNNSFFDDVEKNLNVVYPEDRQGNYDTTRPEFIREALSEDDHFDRYYRLMVDGKPSWARMRIVYKDAEKKNIIIGVFNAGNDVEAKQIAEQKEQLQKAYDRLNAADRRNVLLHQAVKASTWSYAINAEDEIIAAYYDSFVEQNTVVKITDEPMSWVEALHPEDRERVLAEFMATIHDHTCNTPYETTYRVRNTNGKYLWAKTSGRLSRHEDGTAELIGISINITEQMEEQLKHLLGAMPLSNDVLTKANIGLWAFELDEGQPPRMYDDETMLGLVGLDHQVPPEEAYHAWYDHIDEGSYDLVEDAVAKMMSGEHAEVQYPWHYPDGRTIIVRCGGVRNFEYTKGIRIEGTHQNVTQTLHFDEEQRRREEQQRQDELARVRAEASDKAKTEFLFNMSHDIRTPMNAILGYTDIGLRHVDDIEKSTDSYKKIKTAGGHLLNLINDILEMSRIEYGKLELNDEPTDMRQVAEVVKNMGVALAIPKSIDFDMVIGDLKNPYVYADELHGNEVFINLISNAVKYTHEGGKVRYYINQISNVADGKVTYRFEVVDNGIGMSEEFQQHLFETFSREHTSTVSRQEGTGLGLSIVKRILDMAGGSISVRSKQGEGSTFTVEAPFRVMDEEAIEAFTAEKKEKEEIEKVTSLEGKRVLLVEDNAMNREIAEEILAEIGLEVETAEDGELALKAVIDRGVEYYDFILTDIQMPVMNGYELTKAIRKLHNGGKVPIIAVSANAFEEDKRKSMEAGMNAHVAKPINVQELLTALAKYI